MLKPEDIIIPDWPLPATANIRAVMTTRAGGVSRGVLSTLNLGKSVGDDTDAVAENRQRVANYIGATPRWMSQVHGVEVANLDTVDKDAAITADAVIARQPGNVCTIMTADCLPLLFSDRAGTVVGAAHAGWRGLAAGVIEATVRAMNAPVNDMLVYLGPAIGSTKFEVGNDVRDTFLADDAVQGNAANALFGAAFQAHPAEKGKWFADIYALARLRLARVGVHADQIYGGDFCTVTDETRFFSHRRGTQRGEASGRMVSMIWIEHQR